MNNSIFIFTLNKYIKITIEPDEYSVDTIDCFQEASFSIIQNNQKILLCHNFFSSYLEEFIIALKQSVQKNRQLDSYFFKNIGYYWNESMNGVDPENPFNENYALLKKYALWESHITTWIYNDEQGNIILEITPYYPYAFSDEYSYQDFLTWMQNYKPLLKTILPRHTAEQWLIQAQQILDTIDENTQMLHEQGKL